MFMSAIITNVPHACSTSIADLLTMLLLVRPLLVRLMTLWWPYDWSGVCSHYLILLLTWILILYRFKVWDTFR